MRSASPEESRPREVVAAPSSQFWIGRYGGEGRLASVPVTPIVVPLDGLAEPDHPRGYVMTLVLGELLLQGVRFTSSWLEIPLAPEQGFSQIWPPLADAAWPSGQPVDDRLFQAVTRGANLVSSTLLSLRPWKPAVELPASTLSGSAVHLPTPCGKHAVYYPSVLAVDASRGIRHAFVTSCECQKVYLVITESDGAHFKAEGAAGQVEELYEALVGDEQVFSDAQGSFSCKVVHSGS